MQLDELPPELLLLLPQFLCNIEDFNNASSTCRKLHSIFKRTSPNTILYLAAASGPKLFSPHPHFIVLATAREVGNWAIGSDERTKILNNALGAGMDGLLSVAIEHAGLTMDTIRDLHRARFSIINPLSDTIDKMIGNQWYSVINSWEEDDSQPDSPFIDTVTPTFQILIYSELFASTMLSCLEVEKSLTKLGPSTRLAFVKYCLPDKRYTPRKTDAVIAREDQQNMWSILRSRRLHRIWKGLESESDRDYFHQWQYKLWLGSLPTRGLSWLELAPVLSGQEPSEELKERLGRAWKQFLTLEPDGIGQSQMEKMISMREVFPSLVADIAYIRREMRHLLP